MTACSVVCIDCSPDPRGLVTRPAAGDHRCWRCGRSDAQMIYSPVGTVVVELEILDQEPEGA